MSRLPYVVGPVAVAILIVAWPVAFGGTTPAGRALVELSGWALILTATWVAPERDLPRAARVMLAACAVALVAGAAQVMPVPFDLADRIAPASRLRGTVRAVDSLILPGAPPERVGPLATAMISVSPQSTWGAVRLGLALAGIAWAVARLTTGRPRARRTIAWGALVAAGAQGLYGSLAVLTGTDSILGIPKLHYLGSATGTFVNRNHYASYLAGTAALGAGLLAAELAAPAEPRSPRDVAARRWLRVGAQFTLLGLAVTGLALSLSRAGIVVGLAALAALVARARIPGRRGAVAAVAIAGIALAAAIADVAGPGIAARLSRSADDAASTGGRLAVWRDSLRVLAEHPVLGTGYGTFEIAYPAYRSRGVILAYDHAHNEWLEHAVEAGSIGATAAAVALAALAAACAAAWRSARDPLVLGAVAGTAALLAHATVDFGLHMPAIGALLAVTAATAAGHHRGSEPLGPRAIPNRVEPGATPRRPLAMGLTAALAILMAASVSACRREHHADREPATGETVLGPSWKTRARTADARVRLALDDLGRADSPEELDAAAREYRAALADADVDLLAGLRAAPTRSATLTRLLAVRWERLGAPNAADRAALLHALDVAALGAPGITGIQLDLGRLRIAAGDLEGGSAALRRAVELDASAAVEAVGALDLAGADPGTVVDDLGGRTEIVLAAERAFVRTGQANAFLDRLEARLGTAPAIALRRFAAVGRADGQAERVARILQEIGSRSDPAAEIERAISLGEALADLGRREAALERAGFAGRAQRADAATIERAARLHLDLRAVREAETLARRAIALAAQELDDAARRARLYALLGLTLDALGRPGDAFDAYRRALAIDPTQATAVRRIGAMRRAAPPPSLDGSPSAP